MKKIHINPHFGEFLNFLGDAGWGAFEFGYNCLMVGGIISTIILAIICFPLAVMNGIITLIFGLALGEIIMDHKRPKNPVNKVFTNIP